MTQSTQHKPLSQEDIRIAFMRAVHSMAGAKARWEHYTQVGLNDAELNKALQHELGIFGGSSGQDIISIAYQGSGLKIWA